MIFVSSQVHLCAGTNCAWTVPSSLLSCGWSTTDVMLVETVQFCWRNNLDRLLSLS